MKGFGHVGIENLSTYEGLLIREIHFTLSLSLHQSAIIVTALTLTGKKEQKKGPAPRPPVPVNDQSHAPLTNDPWLSSCTNYGSLPTVLDQSAVKLMEKNLKKSQFPVIFLRANNMNVQKKDVVFYLTPIFFTFFLSFFLSFNFLYFSSGFGRASASCTRRTAPSEQSHSTAAAWMIKQLRKIRTRISQKGIFYN